MRPLKIECPSGHLYYEFSEKGLEWPEGAPHCPFCCKNWIYRHPTWDYLKKVKQVAKISSILKENQ